MDVEIGLYYYRARYYDAEIGQFISEDPIAFGAGLNFYQYVGNEATSWGDPDGLERLNKVTPDPRAGSSHTDIKLDPDTGKVTGYTEFDDKGRGVKRFRGVGKPHGGVQPPLVLESKPGKGPGAPLNRARPAEPDEIPKTTSKKAGKKAGKAVAKKVFWPVGVACFLYDWSQEGLDRAIDEAIWPLGEL